jgi:serine/threonine protein kinase
MKDMNEKCPSCGHELDQKTATGSKNTCSRCLAEFLKGNTGIFEILTISPKLKGLFEPFKPGVLIQDMEILELIGQGGMGAVYKARQGKLDRIVALKILDPSLSESEEFITRFNQEAQALASLSHPNIVQVFDYGQSNGHFFIAMEFVDGVTLRDIMTTNRLDPADALRYVPQICDALEFAHSEDVIHRDIKPENILIDKRGNLKIADFGLAKMVGSKNKGTTQFTESGRVMGTPHYMAPEQFKDMSTVDHRADIYSLGVVFYEMLTGDLPLGRFPVPSETNGVDERLDNVVLKALEQDPSRRYQRISHVKDDVSSKTQNTSSNHKQGNDQESRNTEPKLCYITLLSLFCLPWFIPVLIHIYYLSPAVSDSFTPEFFSSSLYYFLGLPLGITLPLIGCFLGWTSISRIQKSSDKIIGLPLAVLGGISSPLIMLNLFTFLVFSNLADSNISLPFPIVFVLMIVIFYFNVLIFKVVFKAVKNKISVKKVISKPLIIWFVIHAILMGYFISETRNLIEKRENEFNEKSIELERESIELEKTFNSE